MSETVVRVLAVLELLQAHDKITGAEIAQRLDVDPRSVRRYIKQIQNMGIPVEAERGRYGAYQLETGYTLPPLMFREEEIIALTLGLLFIRANQFPLDQASISGALAKIERTVPGSFLDQVRTIQDVVYFDPTLPPSKVNFAIIDTIGRGIWKNKTVRMIHLPEEGLEEEVLLDPYGLVHHRNNWFTAGYCHLPNECRQFPLDRILSVDLTNHHFEQPAEFDPLEFVIKNANGTNRVEQVKVIFHTTMERAKQIMPPSLGHLEPVDDGILFTCPAHHLDWIATRLLSTDFSVQVVQPNALKEELKRLATKALGIINS